MSFVVRLVLSGFLGALLAACGSGEKTDPSDIRVTCQGSACTAGAVSSFINKSAHVWTYQNSSDAPITIDVNFSNLAAGQELAYVFANGYSSSVNALPKLGQASGQDGSLSKTTTGTSTKAELSASNALIENQDLWRLKHSKSEPDLLALLRADLNTPLAATSTTVPSLPVRSVISSVESRVWVDNQSDEKKEYTTTALSTCLAGTGRQVRIWADAASVTADIVNKPAITAFEQTVCGESGAVSRLSRLIGDVWSPVNNSRLLQETASNMLDLHVVIVSAGTKTAWAGYFNGVDTFIKSTRTPTSNEALVFFINADWMKVSLPYTQSLLIHELTHMIYWHKRTVLNNAPQHDTWLNEMVSLMSEDILTPALVKGANGKAYQIVFEQRLPSLLNTGGGFSLVAWPEIEKASPYYSMAAVFGAYLNRQYGLVIYKGLMTDCLAITDGWTCLDAVIKKNGGKGVYEAFNHFALTVFALGDGSGPSSKFSFPAKTDGEYSFAGLDLSTLKKFRPSKGAALQAWDTATTTYFVESSLMNIFTFTRSSITIPPQSQLNIMVR